MVTSNTNLEEYFVDLDEDLRKRYGARMPDDPKEVYKLPEVQRALLSSLCKVLLILLDFKPHTAEELERRTGARRAVARIHDLKKMGLNIEAKWDETRPLTRVYQLKPPLPFKDPFGVICKKRIEDWWGTV
ncbi:MAG: hypothetical protein DRN78_00160 [Thermoproteota archaeon]|nr:MAG: hypothetical protein DRN78_00160 [Candidatus Korarchaeota archaeon]